MSNKEFEVKVLRRYCKGCGLCVEVCSEGKFSVDPVPNKQGLQTAVVDERVRCTGCLKCTTICPDAAIEILCLIETADAGSSDQ